MIAENEVALPCLGIAWDGTGFGCDGTIWGGEFFLVTHSSVERVASFRKFRLPGAEQAIREPRRSALGLLCEIFGKEIFAMAELAPIRSFSTAELDVLESILQAKKQSPLTSSLGRIFDAVASILDIRQTIKFESQAAMELEFATEGVHANETYPFRMSGSDIQRGSFGRGSSYLKNDGPKYTIDWEPMIRGILQDCRRSVPAGVIAARFHNTIAAMAVAVAGEIGEKRIALSGGCFQNKYLTERVVSELKERGFQPYWHQRIPTNDGGISAGQIAAADMLLMDQKKEH